MFYCGRKRAPLIRRIDRFNEILHKSVNPDNKTQGNRHKDQETKMIRKEGQLCYNN